MSPSLAKHGMGVVMSGGSITGSDMASSIARVVLQQKREQHGGPAQQLRASRPSRLLFPPAERHFVQILVATPFLPGLAHARGDGVEFRFV